MFIFEIIENYAIKMLFVCCFLLIPTHLRHFSDVFHNLTGVFLLKTMFLDTIMLRNTFYNQSPLSTKFTNFAI